MALNQPSLATQLKSFDTMEAIQADPRLAPYIRNIYPLTGKAGNTRKTKKTLGKGTFGRVNLEELNEGNVATKYFLEPRDHLCENVSEIATLRYIKDVPNVAQMIRVNSRPAFEAANLNFPAVILGKAAGSLNDMSLYKSWDDVYAAIVQILRGYFNLHSRGIVHRDTKPANMLMTSLGEVWISDFGTSKYLDTHIPVTEDIYTGTIWYAAPELLIKSLMNQTENDYYKSDAWAVGASIAHILRQRAPFMGDDVDSVLDYIFTVKGTPDASDGETFQLYKAWAATKYPKVDEYPKVENVMKQRMMTHSVHKPSDPAVLEKVAEVVAGLLEYDPKKRLSISEALHRLPSHNQLPLLQARPSLQKQYIQNTALPKAINTKMIDIVFDWLHSIVNKRGYSFDIASKHIVLDRTGIYVMSFLYKYKENPYISTKTLQLIGVVGLLLATCYFDASDYNSFKDLGEIRRLTSFGYTKDEIMECIKMYMIADIQFYGRTFLDDLLLSNPRLNDEEIETYGFLNYVCFQKSLFSLYEGKEDILQEQFLYFVNELKSIPLKTYMRSRDLAGVGDKTLSEIKEFIEYVTPTTGGGRARQRKNKKSRRVKKRRYNTTLKVRNGRIR